MAPDAEYSEGDGVVDMDEVGRLSVTGVLVAMNLPGIAFGIAEVASKAL